LEGDCLAVDEPSVPLDVKMPVLPARDLFWVEEASLVFACTGMYKFSPFVVNQCLASRKKRGLLEETRKW